MNNELWDKLEDDYNELDEEITEPEALELFEYRADLKTRDWLVAQIMSNDPSNSVNRLYTMTIEALLNKIESAKRS